MAKIIETPTLETDRLILRPRVLEDSSILQKYFNNWGIIKDLNGNVPWPYPENGSHEHFINEIIPNIKAGKTMLWCICKKENINHPIGLIEFRIEIQKDNQEDRGFWLAEAYWKQGLMTEAVSVVNDYIFNVCGRTKITVQNYADNIGSHRVKQKTGAVLLETKTEKWRGQDRDVEVWELTAKNWRKFKE